MGNAKWVGVHRWHIIFTPLRELEQMYPGEKKNTLKGKKNYWKNKLLKGEIEMPPSPEATQPNPERETFTQEVVDGQLVSSIEGWYEVVTKDNEGEAHVHRLYKHSTKVRPSNEDVVENYPQATPAKITPSRRKPVVRDHKVLFVFSDAQIDFRRLPNGELLPIHDERAIRIGQMICKDIQPDEIINTGDTVDHAGLSHFPADSNHFQRTMKPSYQAAHDMYAQYRADNPHAKITEVDSNHNTRLKKFFLKNAGELYGFERPNTDDYPMFTYPYMANLKPLNINWVSGYEAAQYVYGEEYDKPPIIFKHGMTSVSNGSTASKESRENPENHVVRGHSHRAETAYRTNRSGEYLASVVVGTTCKITGEVPSYYSAVDDYGEVVRQQENWQQGVLVIRDYEGDYEFQHILIRDGKANFNGKTYDGNE